MNQAKAALWQQRLDDWSVSLLSIGKWCRQNGVSPGSFAYWQRILSEAEDDQQDPQEGGWLKCRVGDLPSVVSAVGSIKIHVGSLHIEVEPGFDPSTLRTVLQMLGAAPC